jgi:hemerythrin
MMRTSTRTFETNAFDLRNLDREHIEIRQRYMEIEKAIVCGRGLPHIMEAADSLARMMLLHFTHEAQFLAKLSLSGIQKRHRDANIKVIAELIEIESGLEQENVAAVFQLLLLCKVWTREHLNLENQEFECEGLIEEERLFLLSPHHPPQTLRSALHGYSSPGS